MSQHVYGYKPVLKGSTDSQEIETDRENAAALAKALYTAIGIPMTICCFIYSFLYCTYPRDRDRAKMQALIETEMQQMESDKPTLEEDRYTQLHVIGSQELQTKDIDYEGDESIEFDENDRKRLLSHHTLSDLSKS